MENVNFIPANQLPVTDSAEVNVLCVENGEMKQKSANFTPAQQWPIAEGDEVSVLCIENGEMKQKPAKGLGGGNTIYIKTTSVEQSNGFEVSIEAVPTGTFDALKDGLLKGKPAMVMECNHYTAIEDGIVVEEGVAAFTVWNHAHHIYAGVEVIRLGCETGEYVILPDDRIMTIEQFDQEMGGGE